jgi:hypothetical protein
MFFVIVQSLSAQSYYSVDLQKTSSLTILGSYNLSIFALKVGAAKLESQKFKLKATIFQNKIIAGENELSIAVNNFSSDNKMALRDFKKLMKSEVYPYMKVQLISLQQQPGLCSDSTEGSVVATVSITITGVTKQYTLPINYRTIDGIYNVFGEKKISICDFGLVPPVEMFGLIRVSQWIEIKFFFVCTITEVESIFPS